MNKRDLLNILGEIDEKMIEDAAPNFSKKRNSISKDIKFRMRLIAVAACCSLILCGAIVAAPLINRIVYPDVDTAESGAEEATESPTSGPIDSGKIEDLESESFGSEGDVCAPTEQSTFIENEDETEGGTTPPTSGEIEGPMEESPDIYYGYHEYTEDERFSDYIITSSYCPSDLVGKNVATVTINRQYAHYNSDIVYVLEAEINEVVGADGESCLCYRIVKVDEKLDLYVDCYSYYLLTEESYKFVSLFDIRDKYFGISNVEYGQMRYFRQTQDDYCKNFLVEGELLDKLLAEMFQTNCFAVTDISDESISVESAESVYFSYWSLYSGTARIYDNGYLVFYTNEFGTQIFDIGKEKARQLIDIVIYDGDPQGYIWNETQQKWHKIVFDSFASYPTFNELLDENKLIGQIEFVEEIDYWETKFNGWSPDTLLLNWETRSSVAEIMYRADGDSVIVEDITKMADEGMTFVCVNSLTGNACYITVYSSGHIRVDKYYYFVGTEYTDAILSMVRTNCTTYYVNASCFGWDEKKECWDTYDPRVDEIRTESPGGYDYEWPTWVPDDEQSADVPDEECTEEPCIQPTEMDSEMETEIVEYEFEITE